MLFRDAGHEVEAEVTSGISEAVPLKAAETYQQIRKNYYEQKTLINKGNLYKLAVSAVFVVAFECPP